MERKKGITKAYLLFTASGPILILTVYDFIQRPELLSRLANRGLEKFIAYEVPVPIAKSRYGTHFEIVCKDPKQTDEMRVLDESGERIFKNISFSELGSPVYYEPGR